MDHSTRQYLRLMNRLRWLNWIYPLSTRYALAKFFAHRLNPYAAIADGFKNALQQSNYAAQFDADTIWYQATTHFGVSHQNIFFYKGLSDNWLKRHVEPYSNMNAIQNAFADPNGVFILTYHSYYHHFLVACLSHFSQRPLYAIASHPEQGGAVYQHLKKYVDKHADDCSSNFHGGEYVYVGDKLSHSAAKKLIHALKAGQIVASTNDFHVGGHTTGHSERLSIAGYQTDCAAGSVDLARKTGAKIYVSWMRWLGDERYCIEIMPLTRTDSTRAVMEDYFANLERLIQQYPAMWEGWKWIQHADAQIKATEQA